MPRLFIYQVGLIRGLEVNSALAAVPRFIQSSKYVSNINVQPIPSLAQRWKNLGQSNRGTDPMFTRVPCSPLLLVFFKEASQPAYEKQHQPRCHHLPLASSANFSLVSFTLYQGRWAEVIPRDLSIVNMHSSNQCHCRHTWAEWLSVASSY